MKALASTIGLKGRGDILEEWREIEGFEGLYLISNLGRIYSINSDIIRKTKINNSGYEMVSLFDKGKEKTILVHRLVAKAFCDGFYEGLVVNHRDSDRLNNVSTNLEWVTQRENIHDCMRRGKLSVKEAHAVAHEKRKRETIQLTLCGEEIRRYPSATEAAKVLGVSATSVSRCAAGNRKTAFGFKWKYAN